MIAVRAAVAEGLARDLLARGAAPALLGEAVDAGGGGGCGGVDRRQASAEAVGLRPLDGAQKALEELGLALEGGQGGAEVVGGAGKGGVAVAHRRQEFGKGTVAGGFDGAAVAAPAKGDSGDDAGPGNEEGGPGWPAQPADRGSRQSDVGPRRWGRQNAKRGAAGERLAGV